MKTRFEFNKILRFTDFLNELEKTDQLVRIKKSINQKFESGLVEEKSYKDY